MEYIIDKITYINEDIRTDSRYPDRIGSIVEILNMPIINKTMMFNYRKIINNKEVFNRTTITSRVQKVDFVTDPKYMIVHTENSIYYFKRIDTQ